MAGELAHSPLSRRGVKRIVAATAPTGMLNRYPAFQVLP
jgi:hypothetical protein